MPVDYVRSRDGDTPVVKIRGGTFRWAIRLLECNCFELHRDSEEKRAIARQALDYADDVLSNCDELRWYIPFSKDLNLKDMNIMGLPSFDRLLGYLYVGPTQTINQMLVTRGLATTTKNGKLGE